MGYPIEDGQQIQIEGVATFLVDFGAHMNILFDVLVMIFVLIKLLYESLEFMLTMKVRMVIYFEHIVQSLLTTCLFGLPFLGVIPNHIPLE